MINLKNAAHYSMRVAERMNKQPNEKIYHKSENIRVLTKKYYRLLL
jgi:hypothetical protein